MWPFLLINNFETGTFTKMYRIPKDEESQGLYTILFKIVKNVFKKSKKKAKKN